MKRKLATMAIVGAMAVTAVAPATVFAATGQTNVTYVAGAVAPGGADSGYYVTIPADIMFTDDVKTGTQELELVRMEDVTLPTDLNVTVTVTSTKGAVMQDANNAYSVPYTVDYSGTGASATGSAEKGTGTLNGSTHDDVSVGSFSGEGIIKATATLGTVPSNMSIEKGTQFTDILTYTITQTTPQVSP